MNQKEKQLFLELCKFRNPNREKIAALLKSGAATSEVLGLLFANRMGGVAYNVLKQTELLDSTDREFRNSIVNVSLLNRNINDGYLGSIKFITTQLDSCGVPYALLKGAYLCPCYPNGCRTSNDIDVLIAPDDVGKVSAKLKLADFKQGYLKNGKFVPATRQQIIESKMTRGETVPFLKEINKQFTKYLEVDLNFSLDYKNGNDEKLNTMLKRTRIVEIGNTRIRTLSSIDFFLHLCAHLYKEATTVPWIRMKRDMTFYKFCDIYALLFDMTEEDVDMLVKVACEYGLTKELAYCLNAVDKFFDVATKQGRALVTVFNNGELDEVIAPTEKKLYRYSQGDMVKRFFAKDRIKLLEEVKE